MNRFIALLLLASILFAGCASGPPGPGNSAVEQRPQRIVSLSPNVTEILYGIGAWSQVIAVSEYCTYPEDVKNKPRVNGWDKTNLEQVVALKPDFVIGVEAQEPFVRDKLNGLGVRTLFLRGQKLEDAFVRIRERTESCGPRDSRDANGRRLCARENANAGLPRRSRLRRFPDRVTASA